MSPESLSLLGGPILGPVGPLMFVVFFSVVFPIVGWLVWVVGPFSLLRPLDVGPLVGADVRLGP